MQSLQTSETLTVFFLCMALNPRVVAKAQEEIDGVVGNGRLPTFSDREELRYIDAIIWEVFRWHCVTPLGKQISDHACVSDI